MLAHPTVLVCCRTEKQGLSGPQIMDRPAHSNTALGCLSTQLAFDVHTHIQSAKGPGMRHEILRSSLGSGHSFMSVHSPTLSLYLTHLILFIQSCSVTSKHWTRVIGLVLDFEFKDLGLIPFGLFCGFESDPINTSRDSSIGLKSLF